MTILLVDDDESYRLLLRDMLMEEGHDVMLAEDGDQALERLDRVKIDLVISDVYMPVMDGFRFHKTVRSNPKFERLPFLFVSAYDDQYTMEAVKDPRVEGFVKKGRPFAELLEWTEYLTAPDDKRANLIPGSRPGVEGRSEASTRTP